MFKPSDETKMADNFLKKNLTFLQNNKNGKNKDTEGVQMNQRTIETDPDTPEDTICSQYSNLVYLSSKNRPSLPEDISFFSNFKLADLLLQRPELAEEDCDLKKPLLALKIRLKDFASLLN